MDRRDEALRTVQIRLGRKADAEDQIIQAEENKTSLRKVVNGLETEINLMNNVMDKHCEQMSLMYNMLNMALERKNEIMENMMEHINECLRA